MSNYYRSLIENSSGTNYLDGLVGYWSFDGSNANDIHTGTHNGSIVGSPTFPSGKNGNCIDFGNNTNLNWVNIPDSADFSFVNGTTPSSGAISMWTNFSAFSPVGNWLANKRGATSGSDEWQLAFLSGGGLNFAKFEYNNNSIAQITATATGLFSVGTWYHILITVSDLSSLGSTKIYINGSLNVASDVNSGGTYTRMNNGSNLVRLGYGSWNNTSALIDLKHKGGLDEIAFYKNVNYGATQATELFNAGAGKFYNTF